MDHSKKVAILYASAGHGHEKAAKAVAESYGELIGSDKVELLNTLDFMPPLLKRIYRESYLFQIQKLPWLWGLFYFCADQALVYALARPLRRVFNHWAARRLEEWLVETNPAVVVSAHFLGTEVASHLKHKGAINSKIITVITDYLPHRIWLSPAVDGYVVAIEETKVEMIRRGALAGSIRVLGIPAEKKFSQKLSKDTLKDTFGLRKHLFTVLLTSGGAGVGAMKDIVDRLIRLGRPLQVVAICGTNEKLKKTLEKSATLNSLIKVYGFVNNMDEFMEVSDVLVGKGGGLTVTESLLKGLPMILFQSVPGQETRNVRCVEQSGVGVSALSVESVVSRILELLNDPARVEAMRRASKGLAKPNAALDICRWAEEMSQSHG